MNNQFLAAKLLQGIQQEELKKGEHAADEHIRIKKEKVSKRPLPHCKSIRVSGSAVVAMVLKVIFLKCDEGDDNRKGGENPKRPVLPSGLEEHAMRTVVHKRDNAHPQVSHRSVHEPFHERRRSVPCHVSTSNQQAVEEGN